MGQVFSFTVETFSPSYQNGHRLGDFNRLPVAISAAKHSLDDSRVTLAVVKDIDGTLVYAVDRRREWTQDADMPREGLRGSDFFPVGGGE